MDFRYDLLSVLALFVFVFFVQFFHRRFPVGGDRACGHVKCQVAVGNVSKGNGEIFRSVFNFPQGSGTVIVGLAVAAFGFYGHDDIVLQRFFHVDNTCPLLTRRCKQRLILFIFRRRVFHGPRRILKHDLRQGYEVDARSFNKRIFFNLF